MKAVKFILDSTFFNFNGYTYKQTFDSPMGSPLSPIIADLVLQDLKEYALSRLTFTPPFYYRYVDDIATAAPPNQFDALLTVFNSFHERLRFTLEIGDNDRLNFLVVSLIVEDNRIIFDWFHKSTYSGRYLNYHSKHHITQKRAVAFTLIDRAFLLSHPTFHQKNFKFVISTLLDNGYLKNLIFNWIGERLKALINNKKTIKNDNISPNNTNENNSFLTVSYIDDLEHDYKQISTIIDRRITFKGVNKLSGVIKSHKDQFPTMENNNVVYKLSCADCEATYVDQTCRLLKNRIKEHKRINFRNPTVVNEHVLNNEHTFNWDNVEIMDKETFYYKRLISEMFHIQTQTAGINLQTDTDFLGETYKPVVHRLQTNMRKRRTDPNNDKQILSRI